MSSVERDPANPNPIGGSTPRSTPSIPLVFPEPGGTVLGPPIPSRDDKKKAKRERRKLEWPTFLQFSWAAYLVPLTTLLTMGNGIWSLVLGILEYMTNDAINGPFPPFETGAGCIIVFLSLSMIAIFSTGARVPTK